MADSRPNILFILSDDQGPWALGCAGNAEVKTPHLDRLAEQGMRFDNFFCTSPVCSPARASLVTGRIPSQHGVHDWIAAGDTIAKYEPARNGELTEYLKGLPGYTDYLAQAGYTCGLSGKWHIGDSHHPQKSFEFWEVHAKGGGPYYDAPMIKDGEAYEESEYVTDKITDNALAWLETRKTQENPFYLGVHYTAPHSPWNRDNHPHSAWDEYYNNCPFNSIPYGVKPPEWVQTLSIPVNDEETHRIHMSGYYTAITEMDRSIGRLLNKLEEQGQLENTLIVFTADNGMNMGHHGLYGKGNACYPMNMFEESVKVPFIISHPGYIPAGTVNHNLISQYDFMPTLLDYLSIENPIADELPGISYAAALKGEMSPIRDQVIVYDEYGPVRMVRTETMKYIHRYEIGPNELYDLINDPGENQNLAGNPDYADQEQELRNRLTEWFKTYTDPKRDGSKEEVTGSGQLGLCGAYADDRETFSQKRVKPLSDSKDKDK